MNPADLLAELAAKPKGGAKPKPGGLAIASAGPAAAKPAAAVGPNAVVVDEWGLRRGRELLGESPRLEASGADAFAAADFFAAAFEPDPQLEDGCADALKHQFVTELFGTPEYRELHTGTTLNDVASTIAATAFGEQCAALRKRTDQKQTNRKPGEKPPPGEEGDGPAAEMDVLRAVGKALADASQEVGAFHDACRACGQGAGAGGRADPAEVAALWRRIRNDPHLRRVCELAGRFRRLAQSKQRQKTCHGYDDLVGVEPAGDVGRLLPSELARLADPGLELDVLRRLAERQTLCRQFQGVEPVAKGPVVVCVDESSSMSGEKLYAAKALALALAWVARHQNRWCALVSFSDTGAVEPGSLVLLPPGPPLTGELLDWLGHFYCGGTSLAVPLVVVPSMWDQFAKSGMKKGATDLVLVTDGEVPLPPATETTFRAFKEREKVRLVTLAVGCGSAGPLAAVSDEVHLVSAIDTAAAGVDRVLSI